MPNSLGFGVVPNIQSPVDSDSIKYFSPRIGASTISNRPAFRVYGSNSTNITATTTLTTTQGVTIDYNQGSYYNNTTGIFTAPISGLYSVFMNLRCGSINASQQAILYKNSTSVLMQEAAGNGGATPFGVSGVVFLTIGDTLKVTVTVGSINFDANDNWGATFIG